MSNMIQMYDPKREYKTHKQEIDDAIHRVLDHGIFIGGPEIKELEKQLAEYVDVKHAISLSNGTDALTISLLAMDVQPDDEIITVSHSWISTVETIALTKAKPVFVDIESVTFNMDEKKIEAAITEKTKGIVVVSLYGQIANIDKINLIAEKHGLFVIEDGAQSFGATYNGNKTGGLTTIGTTSFFPSKPLGCYGDGGACFTNDDEIALKIRAIKSHGGVKRFHHKYVGLNARLDTVQAAILLEKLKYFNETIENRNNCADYYTNNLKFLEEKGFQLPMVKDNCKSVWAQYSILATSNEQRDAIVANLKENGINAAIFYPAPLHLQECFQYLDYKLGDFPVTEDVCDRIFNLPCYGEFTKDEQDKIIEILRQFVN